MPPALANLPAAIVGAAGRPIAAWIGGYIGLSLSLALCWIVLVSIGHLHRRRRRATAFVPRRPITSVGRYFWRRRRDGLAVILANSEAD